MFDQPFLFSLCGELQKKLQILNKELSTPATPRPPRSKDGAKPPRRKASDPATPDRPRYKGRENPKILTKRKGENKMSKTESKPNQTRKRIERNITQDLKTGHYLVTKYSGYDDAGVHRSTITCNTIEEARFELEKHEAGRKFYGEKSLNTQITVAQCIAKYIFEKDLEETTKHGYGLRLKRIAGHSLGKKKVVKVKKIDIIRYMDEMAKAGHLSNKTINGDRQLLQAVFNYAVDNEYITHNVVNLVPKKREERFEGKALYTDEVRTLIQAINDCQDIRLKVIVCLGAIQGFRRGEIAGLKWEDITESAEGLKISIDRERVPVGGVVIEKKPKTPDSCRTIPLQELTIGALNEYYEMKKRAGVLSEYIVTANKGTPIYPNQINNMLSGFLKRSGLQHIRLHDLRHTCCTLLIEHNVGYPSTSKYLGHSSLRTTERIYTHLRDSLANDTRGVFSEIFKED